MRPSMQTQRIKALTFKFFSRKQAKLLMNIKLKATGTAQI